MWQSASASTRPSGMPAQQRFVRHGFMLNLIGMILLLLGYGISFLQVSDYEAGIVRQTLTVSGTIPVPVIYVRPSIRHGDAIAIIVHGYSGSKELMIGFGLELARMGVPSYLLDLPGHGESTVPLNLSSGNGRVPQLEHTVSEVVTYARAHSDVPRPKIMLLGHSLGTLVVGEYALNQPDSAITATILVSPILQDMPTLTHPSNLMVIVGADDIPTIITQAPELIGAGCGVSISVSDLHYDCGDVRQGSARRLVVVSGANHITVLTDANTFRAMDAWVGSADALPSVPVESDTRLFWTAVGVACAFLALFPLIGVLSHLLTWRTGHGESARHTTVQVASGWLANRPPLWANAGIFALGVVLTVLLLRGWSAAADALQLASLRTPLTWVGVVLADYTASFSLVLALVVGGLLYALRRRLPLPASATAWRQVLLGVGVFLVLYVTIGSFATYAWERFLLDVPRLVRGIPLTLSGLPLFLLIEGLVAADEHGRPWRTALARLGAYLLICIGIVGAIILDPALGFLALIVPIQAALFIAVAALAWWNDRQRRQLNLSNALIATLVIGWAITAIFPIVR